MAHPVSGPVAQSVEVTELMYADFFGLRELPFNNTPDPRFFYSTPDHEEALASLIYAVKQRKGFVLVTGEVGAGKTLVSRLMLRQFGSSVVFANINHAVRTAGDLMESLCTEFELPVEKGASETQMVRTLHDFLLTRFAENTPVVLVLDEAQNLPVSAFEQLRMIGNLEADDAKLLQIAILGQPELQQMFQSAELRQLKQRLFSSYHLPALDRNATDGYIRYRLSVAGARQTNLFRTAAVDRIFDASRGLPRLINTLCDNAMLTAYSAGKRSIDEEIVEGIIAQLDSQHSSEPRTRTSPAQATPPMWPAPYGYGSPMYPPVAPYAPPPWAYQMPQTYGMQYVQQPQHAATMWQAPATPQTAERPAELPKTESIRERLEQAKKRAARLELRYSGGAAVARDARNAQTGLQSATRHAENVLARIETSAKGLNKREKNLAALSTSVRDVAGELMDLLKDVRSASTESRRERQRAQDLHDKLQRIANRTSEGSTERVVASSSPITTHPNAMANSQPSAQLLKQATALIGENKLASKLADVRNLAQVLGETKKSSDALRRLANGSRERDAAARLEDEVADLARVSETDAG